MADDDTPEDVDEEAQDGAEGDGEGQDGEGEELDEDGLAAGLNKKKFSGRKIILFVAAPLLVVVLGAVAALFLLGGDEAEGEGEEEIVEEIHFFELPELLITLNTAPGKRANYLKLVVSLEVSSAQSLVTLEEQLPRVIDNFQVYLRELRVEDLSGSAGLYRLREELLTRINTAVADGQVKDVLFKEMLVQ